MRILLLLFLILACDINARHFVIVIPSRNNINYYERNLSSIAFQAYDNWHAIYINDASTDGTGDKVAEFISKHGLHNKITLINNQERQGALANIVKAIYMCNPWDVIVLLDGDDWLSNAHVLQTIYNAYTDENVWMTYGSYEEYPSGKKGEYARPIPAVIIKRNSYRRHEWCSSHLRTFYTWLFKSVRIEDLKFNGTFFPMAWDLSFMFPMLELSAGHSKYIPDVLYIYNLETSMHDHTTSDSSLQSKMDHLIRARPPYQPLKQIPKQYLPRH